MKPNTAREEHASKIVTLMSLQSALGKAAKTGKHDHHVTMTSKIIQEAAVVHGC
jgi:hypothetical protein